MRERKFKLRQGFGLIEVLAAAVVLAFLLVGLNLLQKGNRESILRIRVRDGANAVAQDVIDSISALGSASITMNTTENFPKKREIPLLIGSNSGLLKDTMNVSVDYNVTVSVNPENTTLQVVDDQTEFSKANNLSVKHQISKKIDVTVNWTFKKSNQSINVSSLIK